MKNLLMIACLIGMSASFIHAQDNIHVKVKDAPEPDIYIDGKKYDYAIFELLDQSKIESVNVIKHERAIEEYNAPNGVVIIKTKKADQQITVDDDIKIKSRNGDEDPVIIMDGKVSNKEELSKVSPHDIASIDVLKGKKAIDEYNAPNGVIIVKTKAAKKK